MIPVSHVLVAIASVGPFVAGIPPAAAQLLSRTAFPKPGSVTKPTWETRMKVKFRDDLKVRAQPDGTLASLTGGNLSKVEAV